MNRGDGVDEERMGEFLSVLPPHFCICRSLEFSRSLANRSLPRRTPAAPKCRASRRDPSSRI
jgi:hypothetical protein